MLSRYPKLEAGLAGLLGLPPKQTTVLTWFLLSLHDIGKFAKKFQAKVPSLFPNCFNDDPARVPSGYDHAAGGLRLFDAEDDLFDLPERYSVWRTLISAVTGHHGSPPRPCLDEGLVSLQYDYGKEGINAAGEFVRQMRELFSLPREMPVLERRRSRRASFAVAGVAVLADWIGSSQKWFPYCDPVQDFNEYWAYARQQAECAVEEAGVLPTASSRQLGYEALIGSHAPSPMQEWARSVELPSGPALLMIEDETGSGKTEAALMLAHRLMAAERAEGIYVALPTMATANAMFDRLADVHRRLFSAETTPSIALVHGASDMHPGFRSVMMQAGRSEAAYSGAANPDESDVTASAACAAWIADDRRRSFLADAGAGTVDQALLSVLPSRHQSLRLLGLMRRVLILDEVHAYDAYMQREIETLLEFQAGLGGSAIVLSATLPLSIRKRLADAFARRLGGDGQARQATDAVSLAYPMATVCAKNTRTCLKVAGRVERAREVPIRFLRSPKSALSAVAGAARAGKAVLYIRNTVDDAIDAHKELVARGLAPDLFHARFALVDRLQIERRVVKTFGKHSTADRRAGKVLIATQVVEQSLDLDFDVLVTDLAPIDLVIQRAGRLWRHERKGREGTPELLVVSPEPKPDVSVGWYRDTFPRAAHVYKDHARLWLTARVLEDAGAIASPDGLREFIEAVYGDCVEARIPEALRDCYIAAEGRAGSQRGLSTTNVLDFAKGYVRDGGAWDEDVRTPTRLADVPQVTLRLARVRGGRIEPYAQAVALDEPWRAWRLSELNVSEWRISREAIPTEHLKAARAVQDAWTRFDRDKIMVVCQTSEAEGRLVGAGATASGAVRLSYSPYVGLEWTEERTTDVRTRRIRIRSVYAEEIIIDEEVGEGSAPPRDR